MISDHPYKFQGQELTEELDYNMYEYRWRHYDASLGRFVTIDPLARDFPQWAPYVFSGNFVTVSRELEGLEPEFLISQGGKVTSPMVTLLYAAYGYSISSLENTTWIPYTDPRAGFWDDIVGIPESTSASVRGKTVIHDDDQNRSDGAWLSLIIHEQSHREDVDEVGNLAFYLGYIIEAKDGYRNISTEEQAFINGSDSRNPNDYADQLLKYDNGSVLSTLRDSNLSDGEKSSQLESIGSKFRRDVILNDKIDHAQGLLENVQEQLNGLSDMQDDDLLKQAVKGLVNYWQNAINNYKKEQDEITKKYGN